MANKVLPQEQMHLLEYDKRFEAFSNFSFWDYNDPINLDNSLKGQYDLILMDPPFLNAGNIKFQNSGKTILLPDFKSKFHSKSFLRHIWKDV